MDLNYKRRRRSSESKSALKIGLGVVLSLSLLCLLLYCAPGSKYAVSRTEHDGLQSEPLSKQDLLDKTASKTEAASKAFPEKSYESGSLQQPSKQRRSSGSKENLIDVITDSNLQHGSNVNVGKSDIGVSAQQEKHKAKMQAVSIEMGGDLTDTASASNAAGTAEEFDAARLLREKVEALQPGECLQGICKNRTMSKNDFVFAVASHNLNEPALIAGRAARQGIKTYISTNYTQTAGMVYPSIPSETWAYYPDDVRLRSFYEGDTRAALVPFLAFRDLGPTFKWLFYGDDDTIMFIDPVMELVKDLDPEMPYFLTDHFWYSNWNYGYQWHPHWRAPRCLLCNSDVDVSGLRMKMTKACPCTPQELCNTEGGYDNVLDKRSCGIPRSPTLTYSMHGGAGALISVGMLKKVSFEFMEDCVLNEWSTGGDALITICLWKAGYAMTDPGPLWHEDGLTHFDPSPRKLMIDQDNVVVPRAAYILGNLLAKSAGHCGPICQNELTGVVSMHLRSRLLTNSSEGAAVILRGVTRYYSLTMGAGHAHSTLGLEDVHDEKMRNFAEYIDGKFAKAEQRLKELMPNFKKIADASVRWPTDGGAAVFIPRNRVLEAENGTVVLTYDEIVKGGSAGIARDLLEEILTETLQMYPPKLRARSW